MDYNCCSHAAPTKYQVVSKVELVRVLVPNKIQLLINNE